MKFDGDPIEYCDICQEEQAEELVCRNGVPAAYAVCRVNGCAETAEALLDEWEAEAEEL